MYLFHDLLSNNKFFQLIWAMESQHLSNSLSLIDTLVYFDFFDNLGPSDFQNVSGISFLPANFTIDEDNFSSITEHSLVVLDDFSFKFVNKKQAKSKLLDPGHTQFV